MKSGPLYVSAAAEGAADARPVRARGRPHHGRRQAGARLRDRGRGPQVALGRGAPRGRDGRSCPRPRCRGRWPSATPGPTTPRPRCATARACRRRRSAPTTGRGSPGRGRPRNERRPDTRAQLPTGGADETSCRRVRPPPSRSPALPSSRADAGPRGGARAHHVLPQPGDPRLPPRPERRARGRRLLPRHEQLRVLPRRADLPQPRPRALAAARPRAHARQPAAAAEGAAVGRHLRARRSATTTARST